MDDSTPPRRPFGVTLLLWMVLCLSAWGLLRFTAALRWWDLLLEKDSRISPLYLSITGAGWVVAGIVLIWGILSIRRWAYRVVPISVFLWLVEYWIERIFFQESRANLAFSIALSIVVIVITLVSAWNRSSKIYLTKSEEHEQPEKHSTSP